MGNIIFGALFDILKPIIETIKGPVSSIGLQKAQFNEKTSIWTFPDAGGGVGTNPGYQRERIGQRYVPRGPRGPTALAGTIQPSAPIAAPVAQRQAYVPSPVPAAPTRAQIVAPQESEGGLQVGYTGPPRPGGGGAARSPLRRQAL